MTPGTPCTACSRPMLPPTRYDADRTGWSARGFVAGEAHGRCRGCCTRLRRGQSGPATPPGSVLTQFVASFAPLAARGLSQEAIAARLGMSIGAVWGAVARARAKGLLPPAIPRPAAGCPPDEVARMRALVGLSSGRAS